MHHAGHARQTDSRCQPWVNADLLGKSAIVTGSTSGIGLGIARAFAAAGMNVMLNGFGDRAEIDRTVAELAARPTASRSPTRPPTCRSRTTSRAWSTRRRDLRRRRRAGQQRRHPARRGDRNVPDREVERHHRHRPVGRLPRHSCRRRRHEGAPVRPHHQRRLGPRAGRLALQVGLRVGQARHRRPDEDGRAGDGRARHHRQRHLPRLRADPAGREADPRNGQGARPDGGAGRSATCCCTRSRRASS